MKKQEKLNNHLPLQINEYKKLFNIHDRPKSGKINLAKENLYEENIHLKTKLNELIKENNNLKIENQKKDKNEKKKDKQIEIFMQDYQNFIENNASGNSNSGISEEMKILDKVKAFNTINQLKKQFKEVKIENEDMTNEIINLKKSLKSTKISELNVEIFTLNEEIKKLKNINGNIFQENENNKNKIKEILHMQDNNINQKNLIKELNNNISRLELEKNALINEIMNLNAKLTEQFNKINKISADLRIFGNAANKLFKEKKENIEKGKKRREYEEIISNLKKELTKNKDLLDRKNKLLKDFEKMFLKKEEINNNNSSNNKCNSNLSPVSNKDTSNFSSFIKIDKDPSDLIIAKEAHLKSKLLELMKNNNQILHQNKKIKKKNKLLEMKILTLEGKEIPSDYLSDENKYENNENNENDNENDKENNINIIEEKEKNDIDNNLLQPILINNLNFNDVSYIILKNFEARKINKNNFINTLLKNLYEITRLVYKSSSLNLNANLNSNSYENENNSPRNKSSSNNNNSIGENNVFSYLNKNDWIKITENLTNDDIVIFVKNFIIKELNLKNQIDQIAIEKFLFSLLELSKNDIYEMINNFIWILSPLKEYKEKKEAKLLKKAKKVKKKFIFLNRFQIILFYCILLKISFFSY
jgi:hypothetical protein